MKKIRIGNEEIDDNEDLDFSGAYILGRNPDNQSQSPVQSPVYDYKSKILYVPGKGSISFNTKSGKQYESTFWEIILEVWLKNGSKRVEIPKHEIIAEVSRKLGEDWNRLTLRNTLHHLIAKLEKDNTGISALLTIETTGSTVNHISFDAIVQITVVNNQKRS